MNPLQVIIDFFTEMINRIRAKSPAFFKRIQLAMAVLTFAGYFPSILQQWFNITVSGHVIHIFENVAHYCTGAFITAMMSSKSNVVGQTDSGIEVKVTDENKMPFSAAAEKKEVDKIKPPPDTIDVPGKVDLSSMTTAAPNDDSLKH